MLYRRGKKWWVRFTIRGREVRQSSGTDSRSLAEEFEQNLREIVWREQQFGQIAYTWEEAKEKWLAEKASKRSLIRDRQAFAALDVYFGGRALADIDMEALSRAQAGLARGRKPGTVTRLVSVGRAVLRSAVKWGWINAAPAVALAREEKHEPRWITQEQFAALCAQLPPHAVELARFAVATGLRQRNIFRLKWEAVERGLSALSISAADAKGGKPVGIPLSGGARSVLERQRGKHPEYVFTDHAGRAPVGSIKTCWLNATRRAGLVGFRFHDLRHTWAAWHTLAGTPPIILKELGGWASLAMVERYAHLNPGHLAEWAENSGVGAKRKE